LSQLVVYRRCSLAVSSIRATERGGYVASTVRCGLICGDRGTRDVFPVPAVLRASWSEASAISHVRR
jgi:hypothetical protein